MTEEEAKTKWCPLARVVDTNGSANRDNQEDSLITSIEYASRCIGSDCMAWQWDKEWKGIVEADNSPAPKEATGYCGAFGYTRGAK